MRRGIPAVLLLALGACAAPPDLTETPRSEGAIRARLKAVRMDVAYEDAALPVVIDEFWKQTAIEIQIDGCVDLPMTLSATASGTADDVLAALCRASGAAWCVLEGKLLIGERAHIEATHRRK